MKLTVGDMPVADRIRQLSARGSRAILHEQRLPGRAVDSKFEATVADDAPTAIVAGLLG